MNWYQKVEGANPFTLTKGIKGLPHSVLPSLSISEALNRLPHSEHVNPMVEIH